MRKFLLFLLFLLLLGVGLFVLYWLDLRARAPSSGPPVEPPPALEHAEEAQGFQLGGRSQLTRYDEETKRAILRVESEDTRTEGGVDILSGVTLELLDPATDGSVQVRVRAERARPQRLPANEELRPRWEDQLELEGVRVEVLSGTTLAPLTFQTAKALIDMTDPTARRLTGDETFTAGSQELALEGRGFEWDVDRERLRIHDGGHVELLRAGGTPATFTASEGPLEVRRAEGLGAPVTLEAWLGAVLEPGTQSPGRLEARHVVLQARAAAEPGEKLVLERLEADGNVDWTSGEARFQGQRLNASFAPEGRLERARLEGEPRAELTLELSGDVLPAADTREQRVVVLEGQDALDVVWKEGGYELHVESLPAAAGVSPARVPNVVTRDFRLESASSIDGWVSEDRRSARFKASGGVVVTSGEATLETATFELAIEPDASGETLLVGTASGGARLEGKLPPAPGESAPGRSFTLASPDGLKIERSPGGWRVIESTRVEVSLDEPQGFRARAERLSDFIVPRSGSGELAPEGLRFLAQGDVQVEFAQGRLVGEELEVLAVAPVPHFLLRGTPEAKAFFEGEAGEASALEVERTGDTWLARGEVRGSADLGPTQTRGSVRVTFSGDTLSYQRSDSPELLPGERLRTQRVLVEGDVNCNVNSDDQTLVVRCARFSLENRARLVKGVDAPVELGSLFIAEGAVHADFLEKDDELVVDCEHFEIERTATDAAAGFRQLTANGNVRFQGRFGGREELDVGGECEVLVFGSDRRGTMEAGPNERVALIGRVPQRKTPFRLTAERVDFELLEEESLRVLALRPELSMLGLRARAEHFTADDQQGVALSGAVRLSGATSAQVPFTLDAEEVVLVGRRAAQADQATPDDAPSPDLEDQLDSLHAKGNVDFRLSDGLRARGARLAVRRATGLLRLEGAPASFELGTTHLETEWVEFDPVLQLLVGTGRGRMLTAQDGAPPASAGTWTLDFLSVSSLLEPDSVVLIVQEPLFRAQASRSVLRASWAILWLNREALEDLERRSELLDGLQLTLERLRALPEGAELEDLLTLFRSAELAGLLREVYFEGPVEVLSEDELLARADAIYLDAASQHGWLAHATVNLGRQFLGQRQEKLIIKADWLRLSSDGSLRADHATVTACGFDEPHVRVVTGNLKIKPGSGRGKEAYQLVLKDNGVEVYDFLKIPLPTIDVVTDEDFKPLWPTLSLANSARFGTLLSFAFTRPVDRIGKLFDRVARPSQTAQGDKETKDQGEPSAAAAPEAPRKPRSDVDANLKVDGSYLGSRGGLLDLGLEIEAKDDYWFDLYLGLALDTGEDRGFIRIDEDERDTLRRWLRSQAYFDHGRSAWSFSYSDQSDAAVQSEFYEGRFLRYERAENYLQWRRSADEYFTQASAKVRIDNFRTDIEELPSLSAYRGRSPLLRLGPLALLHTGDVRAEYSRRRSGSEPHSPFESPPSFFDSPDGFGALDGFGEREVLRADTSQALELPVPLGAGVRLTPFVSARASGWSEDENEDDTPARLLAEAGARLGASFWKRSAGGALHQLAPFVEYRSELVREDEGGRPVVFDALERLQSADLLRFGSRARLGIDGARSGLDVDLAGAYASDRSDGLPDDWLPLEVFARFSIDPSGQQFDILHEGRYDLAEHRTLYSLVALGTHFGEEWGVQFSHQRGRNADAQALFEAASVSGLYRWTEKWEFEARESFSLLDDQELETRIVLRRYGHDIVLEVESSVREGEGSSLAISVKPRFGYDPPRVGYVPW